MSRNGFVLIFSIAIVCCGLMSPVSAATPTKPNPAAVAAARQVALVQAQKRKHKHKHHHHHKKNTTQAAALPK